jgi:hypothetical protein
MRIKLDSEIYEIDKVHTYHNSPAIIECGRLEFYVFEDSETAGEAVVEYYRDMQRYDKGEFRCLIGEERLLQWACNESDSFGISSFDEFLERAAEVPEEHWASYDGNELSVDRVGKLRDELGFVPTVAYRSN